MDVDYLQIGYKLLAGFLIVAVYIHLSGKGSLAPISALDQVGNIVLGAIIGGPLYNPDISVFLLVSVAGVWAGTLLSARYLSFRRWSIKNVVDGKSIQLMKDGELLVANFGKARLSVRDFTMLLHQRGYPNLSDLRNIWFEYNGQMTVVEKGGPEMALVLVENGEIDCDNLEILGRSTDWLSQELKRRGYEVEDVFLAEWHARRLYVYPIRGRSHPEREF